MKTLNSQEIQSVSGSGWGWGVGIGLAALTFVKVSFLFKALGKNHGYGQSSGGCGQPSKPSTGCGQPSNGCGGGYSKYW